MFMRKEQLLIVEILYVLDNQAWAKIGDVVPITAVFKNTGQRTVSAKFKGVITSENKIVETIDSEFYDIAPGETGNIHSIFYSKEIWSIYNFWKSLI